MVKLPMLPLPLFVLAIFLIFSFLCGSFWLWRTMKITSFREEDLMDALFVSFIGALFLGRLIYVLLNFKDFGFDILKFILINGYPGLSLFGLLTGGLLTFFLVLHSKRIPFKDTADYISAPLLLALGIGKIGTFLTGIDVGARTSFFLKVNYAGLQGGRHLVGLYEGILLILSSVVVYRILFKVRRDKLVNGSGFYLLLIFFSLNQIILDNLKSNHLYFAGLSFNMITAVVIFTVVTILFIAKNRKILAETISNFRQKR